MSLLPMLIFKGSGQMGLCGHSPTKVSSVGCSRLSPSTLFVLWASLKASFSISQWFKEAALWHGSFIFFSTFYLLLPYVLVPQYQK